MIEVQNLSRRYGDFLAVNGVSFQINPGQIVGLLGHNGAGKTTIMKMLTGFLEPTEGQIRIQGQNLQTHSIELRSQLGYLPESPPTYPEMTVFDYLDFAAQLKGLDARGREEAVIDSINMTDLSGKATALISTLSRGYRQRVGVAQAILNRPRVLILDEPTNGLDPTQIEHMRTLIRSLRNHSTVILSTHIMQEVSAMCDRVLMIRNGELALDMGLDDLQQSSTLLLCSSASTDMVQAALKALPDWQVQAVTSGRFRLSSSVPVIGESQTSHVIRALVAAEVPIASIQPEIRDLETVFREVNQVEENVHAA